MRLCVAGDSAGRPLVEVLVEHLAGREGLEVTDLSRAPDGASELYAETTDRAVQGLRNGEYDRGILVCGTGIGVSISANKVPGIRAALTHDTYSAERAALSNDAHAITMGARVIGPELAKAIADTFLAHSFDPAGRSAANVAAIDALDAKYKAQGGA